VALPLLPDCHSVSFHIYPCHGRPISVLVLCVLVCAGRFAPIALGCTKILRFVINCSYDGDSTKVKTRVFNMLLFIKMLVINISCDLCECGD
jgi:hypothetical protein